MNRTQFSFLFGATFPTFYFLLVAAVLHLIRSSIGWDGTGVGSTIAEMFVWPIAWPDLLYRHIFEPREMFEFMTTRYLTFMFAGNFLLYFLIGRWIWIWRDRH